MEVIQTLSNGSKLTRRSPEEKQTAGKVARVRKSRSERLYAEVFDQNDMKFFYERGLVYNLAKRMTLEEAKAWGARLGFCCVCGKKLTDNRSVDAGIGPVCVKKI